MKFLASNELIEAALHTQLVRRCQRAYLHELRNGLQGIATGVDLLTRMLGGKVPSTVPIDKATDMVRRSIGNHERTMQSVFEQLILRDQPAKAFLIVTEVNNAISLLSNDAHANGVTLNTQLAAVEPSLAIVARQDQFRIVLMTLMIRAVDAMSGANAESEASANATGQLSIKIETSGSNVAVHLCSTPHNEALCGQVGIWDIATAAASTAENAWMAYGIQSLVHDNGGTLGYERKQDASQPTCSTILHFPIAT
jgi:hypothetical protein